MADGDKSDGKKMDIHKAAQELGHRGGEKGGPARAKKLSAEQRSKIAKKAADARWKGGGKKDGKKK